MIYATVSTERNNRAVVIGRTPVGSCRSKPIGTFYPRFKFLFARHDPLHFNLPLQGQYLAGRARFYIRPPGSFAHNAGEHCEELNDVAAW
jgi:hypothetical protein